MPWYTLGVSQNKITSGKKSYLKLSAAGKFFPSKWLLSAWSFLDRLIHYLWDHRHRYSWWPIWSSQQRGRSWRLSAFYGVRVLSILASIYVAISMLSAIFIPDSLFYELLSFSNNQNMKEVNPDNQKKTDPRFLFAGPILMICTVLSFIGEHLSVNT